MSEQLFTCPRCERHGFTGKGIVAHVCRGMKPGDVRRRLTDDERAEAAAAAVRAIAAANPGNPHLLRRP